ncbi:MAG: adenylyl-sulfate kinase [Pirellulaceae bacterium]
MSDETNVVWHQHAVTRAERESLAKHSGCVVWFTGLSGCGKSTVANQVDRLLFERNVRTFLLDGDNIRHGLNAGPQMLASQHGQEFANRFGLGFGPMDREENIRRIGTVAELFCSAGLVTLTAFVSPYRKDRQLVRQLVCNNGQPDDFIEVFVNAPLEVCESRDPKGLYKMARAGQIKHFTGIDDPYEPPEAPELELKSAEKNPQQLAEEVIEYLQSTGKI